MLIAETLASYSNMQTSTGHADTDFWNCMLMSTYVKMHGSFPDTFWEFMHNKTTQNQTSHQNTRLPWQWMEAWQCECKFWVHIFAYLMTLLDLQEWAKFHQCRGGKKFLVCFSAGSLLLKCLIIFLISLSAWKSRMKKQCLKNFR